MRNELGRNYISLFGAGACGDLNHINVNKKEQYKGQAVSKDLGAAIGHTALNNIKKVKRLKNPSLAFLNKVVIASLQEASSEKVAEAKTNITLLDTEKIGTKEKILAVKTLELDARGKTWPMEVQAYRLDGETAIVAMPAEIFVELGLAIKKRSPFKHTLVIALANDRPSYVPTSKAFGEGSYAVDTSLVKAGTGEKLVDTALQLLKELQPSPSTEEDSGSVEN